MLKKALTIGVIALATGFIGDRNASAEDSITAVSWGGVYQGALRASFFEPAAKNLGIVIEEDTLSGVADVRVQVESGAVSWDIIELGSSSCVSGASEGLFEPLDYSVINVDGFVDGTYGDNWLGSMFYSTVLSWNTEKYGNNGPKSWADFWDVEKFPGSRSLYNSPGGTLELALLADGVAPADLYPLDVDRAFNKLREIKPHISIWWTSGAQTTQLVKDGEVDMIGLWVSRVVAAQKDGAKAAYTFNQGALDFGCFAIPKGSKNKDLAMRALAEFAKPELQANLPQHIDYGPVNLKAYDTGKIDSNILGTLNSSPENAAMQWVYNAAWWGENEAALQERWDEFITE